MVWYSHLLKNFPQFVVIHTVKAMVFPVMYGCESWTIKKAERQRIDAFELFKTIEEDSEIGEDFSESLGLQRDQTSQFS